MTRIVILALFFAIGCSRLERGASDSPICASASAVAALDGKQVRLIGIYRQQLSDHMMQRPGESAPSRSLLGYVHIELEGVASAYDRIAPAGAPALIALGTHPRSRDEIARYSDKKVSVKGTLVLDPSRGQDPPVAATTRPEASLLDPGQPEIAE
jgi:hypothetical protein